MTISRILIVSDYAGSRGGCELLAQTFRNGLRERGVDAYLLASTVDPFDQDQAPDGAFWGTSGRARCFPEIFNPSARKHLKTALRTFKPDVVHLLMFMTQASPAILPLLADRPVVYTTNTYRVICPTGTRLLPNGSLCTEHPGRVCLQTAASRPRDGCRVWFSFNCWRSGAKYPLRRGAKRSDGKRTRTRRMACQQDHLFRRRATSAI